MADDNDVNKNKYRRRLEDINASPSRLKEQIYRIYQDSATSTKYQLDLESRLARARQERAFYSQEIGRMTPQDERLEEYRRHQSAAAQREARLQEQREAEISNRVTTASRMAERSTRSSLSSEALELNRSRLSKTSEARYLGQDLARQRSQTELERVAQYNLGHQEQVSAQIIAASTNIGDPSSAAAIQRLTRTLQRQQSFGGQIYAALDVQREMGLDERSVKRRASGISEKINLELEREGIQSRVQSGDFKSLKQEMDTYKELRDAVKKTAEQISSLGEVGSDLRDKQEEQIKAYEQQAELVRQIKQSGSGGGGRTAAIERLGAGISAAAGLAQYAFVGSEIEQTRARTGLAALMNQQFFDQRSAMAGDMGSLFMATGGFNEMALERGEYFRQMTRATATADAVGTGVSTAASVVGDVSSRNIGGAIDKTISGVSNLGKQTIGISKGIIQSGLAIEGAGAARALSQEQIRIRTESMQEFFNDRRAAYGASVGSGGISSSLMNEMVDPAMASRIGHIDLNRQKNLFSMGVSQVGRSFRQSAEERANIVGAAANAERLGLMRAEQYMGNLGQITATGGSRKDLEEIMANAVARGMDDADSIGRMVDSTANLAEIINQGRGIGGASAAARALTLGIDTYQGTNIDENLRRQGAMYGIANLQNMTGGADMNLGTLSQVSNLSRSLPGVSGMALQNVVKLGTQGAGNVLEMMRGAGAESTDTKRKIQELGLSSIFYEPSGALKKDAAKRAQDIYQSEMVSTASTFSLFANKDQYEEYMSFLQADPSKRKFSDLSLGTKDILAGIGLNEAGIEAAKGVGAGKVSSQSGTEEPKSERKLMLDALKMQTETSVKYMNSFNNSLNEVVVRMKRVVEDFDPEKSFSKTQQAVEKMHLDTKDFDGSVKTFKDAVDIFARTQGINSVPKVPEQPTTDGSSVPSSGSKPWWSF